MLHHHNDINWPCELSIETKQQLLSIASTTSNISQLGIPPYSSTFKGIAYVKKGVGYLSMLNYEFNSSYGLIIGKNDWIGAVSIGDFDTSMAKAEEVEAMDIVFFEQQKVELLAKKNHEIYQWLFAITKAFSKKWANHLSYQNCNSALRVLYTLTEVATYSSLDQNGNPCIKASQKQIGDICIVSRSRVNETIQKYKRLTYIDSTRECIHVLNFDALFLEAKSYGFEPIT